MVEIRVRCESFSPLLSRLAEVMSHSSLISTARSLSPITFSPSSTFGMLCSQGRRSRTYNADVRFV